MNQVRKGFRDKSKKSVQSQLNDLRQEFGILQKQFQQVNMKLAHDFKQSHDNNFITWEYMWSVVEALKVDGKLDFLNESNLEKFHDIIRARWKSEALEDLKNKATPGQGVCTRCHHVNGGPNFFISNPDVPTCPNCMTENTLFLKDTVVDNQTTQEKAAS